jgi:hypothetical protein
MCHFWSKPTAGRARRSPVCGKVCVAALPEFPARTAKPASFRQGLIDPSATMRATGAIEVFQNWQFSGISIATLAAAKFSQYP